MADVAAVAVAGAAIGLALGFVYYAEDLANTAYLSLTTLVRVVLLLAGLAALATGQYVAGFATVFVVALWALTQKPYAEVL